jgi:hypothetical protein
MGYEDQILNTLGQIQNQQVKTAGKIGGIESDVQQIRANTDRNTEQISAIRRSRPTPQPPVSAVIDIVKKLWPIVIGIVIGAGIFGAVFGEKLLK